MRAPLRGRVAIAATVAVTALAALAAPTAVNAQEGEPMAQGEQPAALEQERLEVYAAIHQETAEVARRFYAELARTFETQRKATLRTEMDEELEAVREKHGMTPDEYKRITYLISVDQALRDQFDSILAGPGGGEDSGGG